MDITTSDASQPSPQQLRISLDNLEAITGAIERLNHLGIAIRRLPVTSYAMKARKFAERFDSTSFEAAADLALKSLYPDAGLELLGLLTRAMTETYALFRYRQSRQEQLQNPRSQLRRSLALSTIDEEPTAHADDGSPLDFEMQTSCRGEDSTVGMPRPTLQPPPVFPLLRSEPTSLDSQEVQIKLQKQSNSVKSRTKSILVNQVDYPRPSKGSLACEWCFSPLPKDAFEGEKWK